MRFLALCILLAAVPARADDCDLLDPAPGTGATQIAQTFDACMGEPDCKRVIPPPPRERHGFISAGDATLGALNQAQSDGETLSAGELAASGRIGWRSGPQACGSTDIIAGTQSRGDTAFHVVFPWPFFETAMFGFEQQWQLRPRLDSSRIYLRRLYSSTDVQAGIAPVAWAHQDGGTAAILPFRVSGLMRDQDRSGATLQTIRFSLYESDAAAISATNSRSVDSVDRGRSRCRSPAWSASRGARGRLASSARPTSRWMTRSRSRIASPPAITTACGAPAPSRR